MLDLLDNLRAKIQATSHDKAGAIKPAYGRLQNSSITPAGRLPLNGKHKPHDRLSSPRCC